MRLEWQDMVGLERRRNRRFDAVFFCPGTGNAARPAYAGRIALFADRMLA
jgi:hypothetical protein